MKVLFKLGIMMSIVFGFFCFSSCGYQVPEYEKIADAITAKTAKKLEKEKGLLLIGTGGQMMNDIQMMMMGFNFYQEIDLKTARKLIVYVISEYLSQINNNKDVRPYLHEYPFTAKNVEIEIFIYHPNGSRLPQEKIYCISAINGSIYYYRRGQKQYTEETLCEETYEEALKLARNIDG